MKVYLDTTVIQVLLFGEYTEKDRERLPETRRLYDRHFERSGRQ
jgi:hypothetical protein